MKVLFQQGWRSIPGGVKPTFLAAEGATTALPPTKEEIEKLLAVAPSYGVEIKLPQP